MPDTATASTDAFLAASPCAGWRAAPLAGDASARRYARLHGPDGATAILMEDPGGSLPAFLRIARHLAAIGLAAPRVLRADEGAGLALLEDLGDTLLADRLDAAPAEAPDLYAAATDVLGVLQAHAPPPDLPALTPEHGAAMIAPLWEWFAPGMPAADRDGLARALGEAMALHTPDPSALSLRDYHAENLVWRPGRTGTDRVGLLDFQDAFRAPPEYDLASLLSDARRAVPAAARTAARARFAAATGRDEARVAAATAILGLQRNLRILGVFARLAERDGKRRYLAFLPVVRAHIAADLAHPAAAPLRGPVGRMVAP